MNLLFNITYPDLRTFYFNSFRAIFTTKNVFVDEINDMFIYRFSESAKVYTIIDENIEPNDQCQFKEFFCIPYILLTYQIID